MLFVILGLCVIGISAYELLTTLSHGEHHGAQAVTFGILVFVALIGVKVVSPHTFNTISAIVRR